MKKTSIVLVLPALLLTGCKTPEFVDFGVACRDRTVTVNHVRDTSISHTHPTVEMCQGFELTIRVVPPVGAGNASSTPGAANPGASWLDRSTNESGEIDIDVPDLPNDDVVTGAEFKYTVTINGIGSLDPTIRIIQ